MIQTVLSNAQHPEYGQATISFPISKAEYDHVVEMLEQLEIGDAVQRDCRVDEITGSFPILKRLGKVAINVESWTIWPSGWTALTHRRKRSFRRWL
jgi:hypothetical protein